jgi:C4-dicarboxylate-specific signal transduction histidine kinase
VIGALLAIGLQAMLIAALLFQWRRRRKAEVEARRRGAELAQASRLALAGELTASISHEINQPLGAILANTGAADALLESTPHDIEEFRRIIADIRRQDLRASEFIRHVRSLLSGRAVERRPADINAIALETVEILAHEAARRGVKFETELSQSVPALLLDQVQLQQVLIILCVNGMDAMAEKESPRRIVTLRTLALPDGRIEMAVSDRGPGIAPENLSRLFDSFFTTKPQGMGLGLSMARSIVEAHEGTIRVENHPDGGAIVTITLPLSGEAKAFEHYDPVPSRQDAVA